MNAITVLVGAQRRPAIMLDAREDRRWDSDGDTHYVDQALVAYLSGNRDVVWVDLEDVEYDGE